MRTLTRSHRTCIGAPLRRHVDATIRRGLSHLSPHIRETEVWMVDADVRPRGEGALSRVTLRLKDGTALSVSASEVVLRRAVETAVDRAHDRLLRHIARRWWLPSPQPGSVAEAAPAEPCASVA